MPPEHPHSDAMLMQDKPRKNVGWNDSLGTEHKLAHDDSTNDLINQETVVPVTTHRSETPDLRGIMKVTSDPFYAECFPPSEEEKSQKSQNNTGGHITPSGEEMLEAPTVDEIKIKGDNPIERDSVSPPLIIN